MTKTVMVNMIKEKLQQVNSSESCRQFYKTQLRDHIIKKDGKFLAR